MKRKFLSSTYLRDVSEYELKIYFEEDRYVIVKKLIKVDKIFIIKDNLIVMDDNYYVFEVVPKTGNITMRLFIDDKKKALEYYFDICKNINITSDTKIPYYDDLYLDVTYLNEDINILDKNELDDALHNKDISIKDYELVMKLKDEIIDSLKNNNNELMKIDYNKYLF